MPCRSTRTWDARVVVEATAFGLVYWHWPLVDGDIVEIASSLWQRDLGGGGLVVGHGNLLIRIREVFQFLWK